jgi:hypothetical protein
MRNKAREVGDSGSLNGACNASALVISKLGLSPVSRAQINQLRKPGVPLRSTPGFMLTPAPRAKAR